MLKQLNLSETTSMKKTLIWGIYDSALLLTSRPVAQMWPYLTVRRLLFLPCGTQHRRNEPSWWGGINVVLLTIVPMVDRQCFLRKDLDQKGETWKKNSKVELILLREQSKMKSRDLWEVELTCTLHVKPNFCTRLNRNGYIMIQFLDLVLPHWIPY